MIASLADNHENVRRQAAWALGNFKDIKVVEALIASLSDIEVRGPAAEALQQINNPIAIKPIMNCMRGIKSIFSIYFDDNEKLLKSLIHIATCHPNHDSSMEAVIYSLRYSYDFKNYYRNEMSKLKNALYGYGHAAVEPLLISLDIFINNDSSFALRETIAILGQLKDSRAVEPILSILSKERSCDTLEVIVEALGELGDQRAVDAIIKQASYSNWGTMSLLCRDALQKIGGPNVITTLQKLEKYRSPMDLLPDIEQMGELNPNMSEQYPWKFVENHKGHSISIDCLILQYCIYCKHFNDPVFNDPDFPNGGGYCGLRNGAIGFNDSCVKWTPSPMVNSWFSKAYLQRNHPSYHPWYQVIDDE